MSGAVDFTEKCCSWCGKVNWDSDSGGYDEHCNHDKRVGMKCDTNGEVRKYDQHGNKIS